MQIVLLGLILICLGVLSDTVYAIAAGGAGNWIRGNMKFLRVHRYFAGGIYIGLGALSAVGGPYKK